MLDMHSVDKSLICLLLLTHAPLQQPHGQDQQRHRGVHVFAVVCSLSRIVHTDSAAVAVQGTPGQSVHWCKQMGHDCNAYASCWGHDMCLSPHVLPLIP